MRSNLLSKSRLGSARLCLRLHDIVYLQGYRPVKEADPLRFGTLIHGGLEGITLGRDFNGTTLRELFAATDPWDLAKARPMLQGYAARWSESDRAQYDVLGVEQQFETDLVNPKTGAKSKTWRLGGKLDAVVREKATGRVLIVEHKTSAQDVSVGSAYWKRLRMDQQCSVYFAGARALGYDPAGILYDVLKKPALRPYKANTKRAADETPEEFEARCLAAIAEDPNGYYQRGEVARLDSEMEEAMTDIWEQAQMMRSMETQGRAPRNPDACEKWGRMCEYFEVCTGEASLDDPTKFVKLAQVHPELGK